MNEKILSQEQRTREIRKLKWQSIRGIALLCLGCLCILFSAFLQSVALVSPPVWVGVVVSILGVFLCPLVIILMDNIFKTHDRLRQLRLLNASK